jgi:predicted nucleotidyltransferase component of viral defense system
MSGYPKIFGDVRAWSSSNGTTVEEGKRRFVQYGILCAVGTSRTLSSALAFKGGNALDFVWRANRSTFDLDFSSYTNELKSEKRRKLFGDALLVVGRRFNVDYKVQAIEPKGIAAGKTFVKYAINIGYALEDEAALKRRLASGANSPRVIPVEISLNEPICDTKRFPEFGHHGLQVSSLEDIVAEKLRSLLQQPIRNRHRRQDLLDIAVVLRSEAFLDEKKVADYLLTKATARGVSVSRSAFDDPRVKDMASVGFDALRETTRVMFIEREEAWGLVKALVMTLDIPDVARDQ